MHVEVWRFACGSEYNTIYNIAGTAKIEVENTVKL